MILTVLAEKGGTGKTKVATNLAGMRAGRGRRVLLIDADRQGSSERWGELRSADRLPRVECAPVYGAALRRYLQTRVSRYHDVVIDVGAGDSDEMGVALAASDCAVIPVRPTAADVWTMTLMDGRIAEAMSGNPGLAAWALINLASTNPRQPAA
ncbi:MAG: AAA family ATPase [Dehalococcoidia bacterium]|nr:AAA family ATPase [Dehalococcoidia bacterium]